jgi:hypothetical protein
MRRRHRVAPSLLEIARKLQAAEERLEALSQQSPLIGLYLQELREIRALVADFVKSE